MDKTEKEKLIDEAKNFHCPRYSEIPDMGLYLEQVLNILNEVMGPILPEGERTTGAMISNYIKNNALEAPVKKKYYRNHLCYLMVITILKQVFTLQQIGEMFSVQRDTYPVDVAYDYFCQEFENALKEVFEFTGKPLPSIETKRTAQTILLRAMVLAVSNKIFINVSLIK